VRFGRISWSLIDSFVIIYVCIVVLYYFDAMITLLFDNKQNSVCAVCSFRNNTIMGGLVWADDSLDIANSDRPSVNSNEDIHGADEDGMTLHMPMNH
jgi:hypothetical protein